MKSFYEQKYPVARRVQVTFPDGESWEDGHKGLNIGHALYLARVNWDGAEITDLGPWQGPVSIGPWAR